MTRTERLTQYLKRDIWRINEEELPLGRRLWVGLLKRLIIVTDGFLSDNLTSYAAALTYNCILAAVPVLAIIFAVARGFNFGTIIEEQLRSNLSISPDIADTIFEFVNSYLEHTHSGIFLGVGLLVLLYTVVMLTSNIETAFNTMWHVRTPRNIYRRIIDYVTVFVILPLIIVVTSGFSVFMITLTSLFSDYVILSNTMEFVIQVAPMLLWCIAFVALYKLMPNTHVKWRSVLIPGLIAGALFQVVQYIYINFQIVLSSYNAIYGTFAALPMFMLWLNISWIICLTFAQLSYANQSVNEYAFAKESQNISRCDHDTLCILLMQHIAHRFTQGMPPYSTHTLSRELRLPHSMVQGLLDELVSVGLLSEAHDETGTTQHYLPRQDIHRITINNIINHLDTNGLGRIAPNWVQGNSDWNHIRQMRAPLNAREGEITLADLGS